MKNTRAPLMLRIVSVLVLFLTLADQSLACRRPRSESAPFLDVIMSSTIVSIGQVTDVVQYFDREGRATQIATFKILHALRGADLSIYKTWSAIYTGAFEFSCWHILSFELGAKYLFTPNFNSQNAFEKVASEQAGVERFKKLEKDSLRNANFVKFDNAVEYDIKEFSKRFEVLLDGCENKKNCDNSVIEKVLYGEDADYLSAIQNEEIGTLLYRFLSLKQTYNPSESSHHNMRILAIAVAQRDLLVQNSKKRKKAENDKLRSRLDDILRFEKIKKIDHNGKDVTKDYFVEIK